MSGILRLSHAEIRVPDLELGLAYYAEVVGLGTNPDGTAVTEVVVDRDGATETYTGDIVVVACGAANSARLLLASASDAHPAGLANGCSVAKTSVSSRSRTRSFFSRGFTVTTPHPGRYLFPNRGRRPLPGSPGIGFRLVRGGPVSGS